LGGRRRACLRQCEVRGWAGMLSRALLAMERVERVTLVESRGDIFERRRSCKELALLDRSMQVHEAPRLSFQTPWGVIIDQLNEREILHVGHQSGHRQLQTSALRHCCSAITELREMDLIAIRQSTNVQQWASVCVY
jgi:hypothetical protein